MKIIILGLIQGLTEFLPVSSSGHLVVAQKIMGLSGQTMQTAALLHFGTVMSLFIYFFKDIMAIFSNKKLFINIALVTLVTGVIGILGKHLFELMFESSLIVSIGWIITAVVLFISAGYTKGTRQDPNIKDSFLLGLTQGIAIIPGLSRSGTTIVTLLCRGIAPETAFKYSFLAGIPAITGAFLVELKDAQISTSPELLMGVLAAFLSGLLALKSLSILLKQAKLHLFGYYCLIAAITNLILS